MRQRYGRIIHIESVSGLAGSPDRPATAPRAGSWVANRWQGSRLSQYHRQLVAPGMIATEMTAGLPEPRGGSGPQHTAWRLGQPADVATAVVFCPRPPGLSPDRCLVLTVVS